MLNTDMIESLIRAYREDQSCINWLKFTIRTAPSGIKTERLKKDLQHSLESRSKNYKMLELYYLAGITSEQIQKDIQR